MGRINVLDKSTAELIAAGEVVERPSSVIKELLENSIDAGASAITVEIQNGGISYMRIKDNGCGIMREDVPKAFIRHATSKVLNKKDLDSIGTLGFRGEALASVCAVAKVDMLTKFTDEQIGTHYIIEGGEETICEDAGCPDGTTIIVRELFYNVPARMKFLKKDVSEANAVAAVLDRISLSHPEIAFTLIRDGKQTLKTSGDGKLLSAVYSVYGREFAKSLIPVDYVLNNVKVNGYISKPEFARPNRNMQHFFINGRYVKSLTAMKALEQASKGTVMVGKFMSCVINIGISYNTVDVNVHPAKIEVRFVNEKPVFEAVYYAVKTALLNGDKVKSVSLKPADILNVPKQSPFVLKSEQNPLPSAPEEKKVSAEVPDFPQLPVEEKKIIINEPVKVRDEQPEISLPKPASFGKFILKEKDDTLLVADVKPVKAEEKVSPVINEPVKQTIEEIIDEEPPLKFLTEAFNTYIIAEKSKDELVFIDKHAAHERILYEKLKKEKGKGFAQMLLEPVTVTMPKKEYDAVINNISVLDDLGFQTEDFGMGTVIVRSAPQFLDAAQIEDTVCEMAGYLAENKTDINTVHMDWIYHNIACRAAIKGGNISKPEELKEILNILQNDKTIMYCPHGRPISVIVKKREIEKMFGRV